MRNEVTTSSREKGISHNQVQDIGVKDLNRRPRTSVGSNPSADVMSIRTLRFCGRTRIKVPFALRQILTHYTYRKTPNLETLVNKKGPSVSNAFKWRVLGSLVVLKSAPFLVHDIN